MENIMINQCRFIMVMFVLTISYIRLHATLFEISIVFLWKDICLRTENEDINWHQSTQYCWFKSEDLLNYTDASHLCEIHYSNLGPAEEVFKLSYNIIVWIILEHIICSLHALWFVKRCRDLFDDSTWIYIQGVPKKRDKNGRGHNFKIGTAISIKFSFSESAFSWH